MWHTTIPFDPLIPLYVRFHVDRNACCITKIDLEKGFRPWEVISEAGPADSFVETEILPWCCGWAEGEERALPLRDTEETLFLKKGLCAVVRGTTISYSEFAVRTGKGTAVRYAASFLSKNPFPLVIPCHRVIKKSGSYGNYLAGKELKSLLLKYECSRFSF